MSPLLLLVNLGEGLKRALVAFRGQDIPRDESHKIQTLLVAIVSWCRTNRRSMRLMVEEAEARYEEAIETPMANPLRRDRIQKGREILRDVKRTVADGQRGMRRGE